MGSPPERWLHALVPRPGAVTSGLMTVNPPLGPLGAGTGSVPGVTLRSWLVGFGVPCTRGALWHLGSLGRAGPRPPGVHVAGDRPVRPFQLPWGALPVHPIPAPAGRGRRSPSVQEDVRPASSAATPEAPAAPPPAPAAPPGAGDPGSASLPLGVLRDVMGPLQRTRGRGAVGAMRSGPGAVKGRPGKAGPGPLGSTSHA